MACGAVCAQSDDHTGMLNGFISIIELSSHSALAEKKGSWIDFDAGPVLEEESIEACAERMEEMVLRVASGERVKAEKAGLQDIAILKTGVTL